MTKRMNDEELYDARDRARAKADDKAYDQIERREREMDKLREEMQPLIGELQGEAGKRYYINVRTKDGRLTGAIKEFPTNRMAADFLISNDYEARV